MSAKLVWATPNCDEVVGYIARVSNPLAKLGDPFKKLLAYLKLHKHWSPYEMANACVEINTTRDIARQILRHRSFHFQEFSQRYSEVAEEPQYAEARLQDIKNRQNSIDVHDPELQDAWRRLQVASWENDYNRYQEALKAGIAKELARKLLPEGLTRTRMYMNGTLRDWYHYLSIRLGVETQREHREVAREILEVLKEVSPDIFGELDEA